MPLLSSTSDPDAWISFPALELAWAGEVHSGWVRSGIAVHALHLSAMPWGEERVLTVIEALRSGLGPDFLVIPAEVPEGRMETSVFLRSLEALLEALAGRGVKIALKPARGAAAGLVSLLKEVRCDAVGYCWDDSVGCDLDIISDRLFCAVGAEGADYPSLQRLGYRWNVAIPAMDPLAAAELLASLENSHPMIYFPQVLS
ncbi:MAG: hypothetical protein Q8O00_01415 [Holophaga sp.]|nr:hypothetical protein [Holophaga sp.]